MKPPHAKKLSQAKEFAKVERISLFGAVARIGPISLWQYAQSYESAARHVPKPDAPYEPVRYYLVCHAIELALKAYLSLHHVTMHELSESPYGHKLDIILSKAEAKGLLALVSLSTDQLAEIRKATKYYNGKLFEYPAYGEAFRAYPDLPNLTTLFFAASKLVDTLAQPCKEFQ